MHSSRGILLALALPLLHSISVSALAVSSDAFPLRLAMMDMMPGGTAQAPSVGMAPMLGMSAPAAVPPAAMAPGGMRGDGMRMGAAPTMPMPPANTAPGGMGVGAGVPPAAMAGQAPTATPAPAAMPMCPMCTTMMQGMMSGMASPPGAAPPAVSPMGAAPTLEGSAAMLTTRVATMRAALRITDEQAPAWDVFVAALRTGRQHLDQARAELQGSATGIDPMLRLVAFENHLNARAEAIHITRLAFGVLLGQLNDEQKRVASGTMLPFIGAF